MPNLKTNNNIDWYYEVFGEGKQKLLFLHGWGVDRRIWRQQYKYFKDNYQVMILDLPGHGNSSFEMTSLTEMAHDIREVLVHAGFSQFTSIGSSLGGLVSLKMYELFPNTFVRMVFVGSMPKFAKSEGYPYGLDVEKIRKLNNQVETHYPSIIEVFFRSLFTKEEKQSRRFKWLQKFRHEDHHHPQQPALEKYLDLLEQEDLRDVLKTVEVPMQFINGKGDEICTPKSVEYIKSLVPQGRFDDFEKCGHFPFLTQPSEFNEILLNFLEDKDAA